MRLWSVRQLDMAYPIIDALHEHCPPHSTLHDDIRCIGVPHVHLHGIHGSGKTTTANYALACMPGYHLVDENYEAIRTIISTSDNIVSDMCNMLDSRRIYGKCIVDRSSIDSLIYELCAQLLSYIKTMGLPHLLDCNIQMELANRESQLYNIVQCLWIELCSHYTSSIQEYKRSNHVWILPNSADVARINVINRGRKWDDSVVDPYYALLHYLYKHILVHYLSC